MNLLHTTNKFRYELSELDKLEERLIDHLHNSQFDFFTVIKIDHGSLDPHYEVVTGSVHNINEAIRKSAQRRA